MELLLGIGIEEAHIHVVTKQIDDLLEKKKKQGSDGNDLDSSIEEPDVNAEAAHLDEFEALFRVAAPVLTKEEKPSSAMSDFKI